MLMGYLSYWTVICTYKHACTSLRLAAVYLWASVQIRNLFRRSLRIPLGVSSTRCRGKGETGCWLLRDLFGSGSGDLVLFLLVVGVASSWASCGCRARRFFVSRCRSDGWFSSPSVLLQGADHVSCGVPPLLIVFFLLSRWSSRRLSAFYPCILISSVTVDSSLSSFLFKLRSLFRVAAACSPGPVSLWLCSELLVLVFSSSSELHCHPHFLVSPT